MTPLDDQLRTAAADLEKAGIGFALVGGLAVSVHTEPRFTRDCDFAVSVADDAGAETIVRAMRGTNYGVEAHLEHTDTGRIAAVRLRRRPEGPLVDLLFASSGIEAEIVAGARPTEVFPGLVLPVARIGHLVALKLLAQDEERRPQDRIDLTALAGAAQKADFDDAREACALIGARGYARGRDLVADLAKWIDGR